MPALRTILVLLAILALASAGRDDTDGNRGGGNKNRKRDVCIVGGGASGLASAVFLKDRGYDVLVLEVASNVGGHCNTYRYNGFPGFLDVGVVVYQDTDRANRPEFAGTRGTWSLGSRTFVERFVGHENVFDLDFTGGGSPAPNFLVDLSTGFMPNLPPPTPEELAAQGAAIGQAVGNLLAVTLQYPWLNTGKRPANVPAFMLQPFSTFITEHHLEPLIVPVFLGLLTGGGMGSLSLMTTLEALQVLSPVTLDLFTTPAAGFSVVGGCQVLYDNIATWLGSDNIKLEADIHEINRRKSNEVRIRGRTSRGHGFHDGKCHGKGDDDDDDDDDGDHGEFEVTCGKVIVAFYPLPQNLHMLDLTREENSLFSQLQANYYLALAVTATGGQYATEGAFNVNNFNWTTIPGTQTPFTFPLLPNLSSVSRSGPGAPMSAYVNADWENPITYEQAIAIAEEGFTKIPSSILSNVKIEFENYHFYDPHFSQDAMRATPSADVRFAALQGKTNTYWVGAATRYDASGVVWNQAYELVTANFPVKKPKKN